MPLNKQQLQRLRRIDELFNLRKGTVVTRDELMAQCGDISLRTLRYDISYLRDTMQAPIVFDSARNGYYYSHPYTIPVFLGLSSDDMHHLSMAMGILSQFQELAIFQGLDDTIQGIMKGVNGWVKDNPRPSTPKALFFDPVHTYKGTEHIPVFLQAIELSRQVHFIYQSFTSPGPRSITLDPFFIRQFDQRWYVGGFSHDESEKHVRNFPLERIVGKPEIGGFYHQRHEDHDPVLYFSRVYGVMRPLGGAVEEIVLLFSPLQAKYYLSRPFHPYEHIVWHHDGSLEVRLKLMINVELVRKLASFGKDVKVLKPEVLQKKVQQFFQQALERYTPETQ